MSEDPINHDVDIVIHSLLALGVVVADVYVVLFIVPDLFNRHRTELDLAAIAITGGALAFSYLAGRYLWQSIRTITDGEDE